MEHHTNHLCAFICYFFGSNIISLLCVSGRCVRVLPIAMHVPFGPSLASISSKICPQRAKKGRVLTGNWKPIDMILTRYVFYHLVPCSLLYMIYPFTPETAEALKVTICRVAAEAKTTATTTTSTTTATTTATVAAGLLAGLSTMAMTTMGGRIARVLSSSAGQFS